MRVEGGILAVILMNVVVMSMLFAQMDQEKVLHIKIERRYHEGNYLLDYFNEASDSAIPLVDHAQITYRNVTRRTSPRSCPNFPPGLIGKLQLPENDSIPASLETVAKLHPDLRRGSYKPKTCQARHKVAIIIPYRDRPEHLQILLNHLHPVLKRQQLDYTIYTVSFAGNGTFNKAKLVNAGFVEVNKGKLAITILPDRAIKAEVMVESECVSILKWLKVESCNMARLNTKLRTNIGHRSFLYEVVIYQYAEYLHAVKSLLVLLYVLLLSDKHLW